MKNVIDISEYNVLKQEFEILTGKHREILHLVLFKVIKNIIFKEHYNIVIIYNTFEY